MEIINVGNRIMNTYLYPLEDGFVMIDTGYEHDFEKVMRKMINKGITLSDIKYVFLTHAHDDHCGFLKRMLDENENLVVVANEASKPVLVYGKNLRKGFLSGLFAKLAVVVMRALGLDEHSFPEIDPTYDERFIWITEDSCDIADDILGGKILFTPGHTSDSISLRVEDVIFCGDACMNGFPSVKRVSLWIEDIEEFTNSWNTLIAEDSAWLYPSHGRRFNDFDLEKFQKYISKRKFYPIDKSPKNIISL